MGKFPRRRPALLLAALVVAFGGAALASPEAQARYETLLASARSGDATVDWQALRFAYAETDAFDPFDRAAYRRNAMIAAFSRDDFRGALTQAKSILADNFVDIDAHVVAGASFKHLGDEAGSEREFAIADALVKSIQASGDGSSPARPFTVISAAEETSFLRGGGLRITHRAVLKQDGHSYDVLRTADKDGNEQPYYFLADRILAAQQAATLRQGHADGAAPTP